MNISIHLNPRGVDQLRLVTQKTTGQDAPSPEQLCQTFAAVCKVGLERAFQESSKPEPVTKPIEVSQAFQPATPNPS